MPLCHRQFRMQMSRAAVRPRGTRITINNDQRANYRSADVLSRFLRKRRVCAFTKVGTTDRPTDRPINRSIDLLRPLLIAASLPRFFPPFLPSALCACIYGLLHGDMRVSAPR